MKENKQKDKKKMSMNIGENKFHKDEIGFFKFIFGIKSWKANWLSFAGISLLIIYSLFIVLVRILYGVGVNYIKNNNIDEVNFFSLIITLMGPLTYLICILRG